MRNKRGVLFLVFAACLVMLSSCGSVNTKSPEAVVKSLIVAYQNQDEEAAKKCFGLDKDKKCPEELQKEIDYYMNLFAAHAAKGVTFEKSEILGTSEKKDLVYVWYQYEIKTKKETQKLPGLSFYFVKEENEKYYVVPAQDVTEKMSEFSGKEYAEFLKQEEYKEYDKEYQEFSRKNPQYQKSVENKFQDLLKKKKKE